MIHKANWIWADVPLQKNQYADFLCEFWVETPLSDARLQICVDSEYAAWLNGEFVGCGQYNDYPEDRHYDTIPVYALLKPGKNRLCITAYYQGETSMQYFVGGRGLCFALQNGSQTVLSNKDVLSALSATYTSGEIYKTTEQLGYGYIYSEPGEDDWKTVKNIPPRFKQSVLCHSPDSLQPRPIEKLQIQEPVHTKIIAQGYMICKETGETPAEQIGMDYLSYCGFEKMFSGAKTMQPAAVLKEYREDGVWIVVDLGREETGYFQLEMEADSAGQLNIAYGEHLQDLRVRAKIEQRNFADIYICKAGRQRFTQYFRRIAGRYIQIHFSGMSAFKLYYVGILPAAYPLKTAGTFHCSDMLHNKIYEVSLHTLKNCMHEHYEDCPWREQALYASDSRNQMLCGYYAFGEFVFARESLKLLGKGIQDDGFQRICAPTDLALRIPSFTMLWFLAVKEYTEYSGDDFFIRTMWDQMEDMIRKYFSNMKGDIPRYPLGEEFWHFYEWSKGYDGYDKYRELRYADGFVDGMYFVFLYLALQSMLQLGKIYDKQKFCQTYTPIAEKLQSTINNLFWDTERGLYASYINQGKKEHYGELMQVMAMYTGAAGKERRDKLCRTLYQDNIPLDSYITLSYTIYKYDVLFSAGKEYQQYIFDEIAQKWGGMLFQGATSFWETEGGEADFNAAGSLCHGWSGLPVYIYFRYVLGVGPKQICGELPGEYKSDVFYQYSGSYTAKDAVYRIEKKGNSVEVGCEKEI